MEYCKYCGQPINDRLTCVASPDGVFCKWDCHNEYVAYEAVLTASLSAEEVSIDTFGLKPSTKCRRDIKRHKLLKKLRRKAMGIYKVLAKLTAIVAAVVLLVSATCIDTEGTSIFVKMLLASIAYLMWFMFCTKEGRKLAEIGGR